MAEDGQANAADISAGLENNFRRRSRRESVSLMGQEPVSRGGCTTPSRDTSIYGRHHGLCEVRADPAGARHRAPNLVKRIFKPSTDWLLGCDTDHGQTCICRACVFFFGERAGLWGRAKGGRMVRDRAGPSLAMEHPKSHHRRHAGAGCKGRKGGSCTPRFEAKIYIPNREARAACSWARTESAGVPWSRVTTPWDFGPDCCRTIWNASHRAFRSRLRAFSRRGGGPASRKVVNGQFTVATPDGNPLGGGRYGGFEKKLLGGPAGP